MGSRPDPIGLEAAATSSTSAPPSSFMDRASRFLHDHKGIVYTIGASVAVVTTAGGIYYVYQRGSRPKKASKSERKRNRKDKAPSGADTSPKTEAKTETKDPVQKSEKLPEISTELLNSKSTEEKNDLAGKLKIQGNEAFSKHEYETAIDLYTKALMCKDDQVFYANRAACFAALDRPDDVIADTTTALNHDRNYVKALNRRSAAYEKKEMHQEALIDATTSCILAGFADETMTSGVERLLRKVAEHKAKDIMASRGRRMPPASFVHAYLNSFRPEKRPEIATVGGETGDGALVEAYAALDADRFTEAFEKASAANEKGCSSPVLKSRALNMMATFHFLQSDSQNAYDTLSKAIEADPAYTQNYVKRASVSLELGNRDAAWNDFVTATGFKDNDPDVYYHRGQLHYILGEFNEAAKDYQKSIELDPNFVFSHVQLGVCQYKMGSVASSMATFRRTIKTFKKSGEVHNYFGELLLDQSNFAEAIQQFDRAVELEKKKVAGRMSVLPIINKALAIFQDKNNIVEAEKICRSALEIDPECDIAVASMAQFLLQQGKADEALKYFEKSADIARTEPELVNALSYAEATRTQLTLTKERAELSDRLKGLTGGMRP